MWLRISITFLSMLYNQCREISNLFEVKQFSSEIELPRSGSVTNRVRGAKKSTNAQPQFSPKLFIIRTRCLRYAKSWRTNFCRLFCACATQDGEWSTVVSSPEVAHWKSGRCHQRGLLVSAGWFTGIFLSLKRNMDDAVSTEYGHRFLSDRHFSIVLSTCSQLHLRYFPIACHDWSMRTGWGFSIRAEWRKSCNITVPTAVTKGNMKTLLTVFCSGARFRVSPRARSPATRNSERREHKAELWLCYLKLRNPDLLSLWSWQPERDAIELKLAISQKRWILGFSVPFIQVTSPTYPLTNVRSFGR